MSDDDIESIRERKREELQQRASAETDGGESATEAEPADRPTEPVHVESPEHFQELISSHPLVLVDFHAEWCGPCKMMEPAVEAVAADGPAVVAKLDIDEHQGLAQQHGIRGVPTLKLYRDGEEADRVVGMQSEDALRDLIANYA
jgi:thioredoxin 1